MQYKDYYKVLGVDKKADTTTIKKTYRKLAKKYHPDVNQNNPQSEKKFKEVSEAYEVLKDSDKREKYDMFGSNYDFANGSNFDPSAYGGRSYQGGNQTGFSDFFDSLFGNQGINIDELFRGSATHTRRRSSPFGGFNGGGFHSAQPRGQHLQAEISVSIKEAYNGTEKLISFSAPGMDEKRVNIKVPAGIKDGGKLRIKRQGIDGGDLRITIRIKDGRYIHLDGIDITKEFFIKPYQAALGDKIQIELIDDTKITLTIPPATSSGRKFRVSGKGYKTRDGKKGTLYLKAMIKLSKNLSEEEKELYIKLKEIREMKST